jgi:hypothetical protein
MDAMTADARMPTDREIVISRLIDAPRELRVMTISRSDGSVTASAAMFLASMLFPPYAVLAR